MIGFYCFLIAGLAVDATELQVFNGQTNTYSPDQGHKSTHHVEVIHNNEHHVKQSTFVNGEQNSAYHFIGAPVAAPSESEKVLEAPVSIGHSWPKKVDVEMEDHLPSPIPAQSKPETAGEINFDETDAHDVEALDYFSFLNRKHSKKSKSDQKSKEFQEHRSKSSEENEHKAMDAIIKFQHNRNEKRKRHHNKNKKVSKYTLDKSTDDHSLPEKEYIEPVYYLTEAIPVPTGKSSEETRDKDSDERDAAFGYLSHLKRQHPLKFKAVQTYDIQSSSEERQEGRYKPFGENDHEGLDAIVKFQYNNNGKTKNYHYGVKRSPSEHGHNLRKSKNPDIVNVQYNVHGNRGHLGKNPTYFDVDDYIRREEMKVEEQLRELNHNYPGLDY